jgi:beta-glucosidase
VNNEGKLNEKLNDMKRFLVLILAIIPVCGMMAQSSQESKRNKFVDNLMKKMTIEEKIGQLNMPNIDGAVITGPVKNTDTGERLRKNGVGALLNLQDVKKIRKFSSWLWSIVVLRFRCCLGWM